MLIVKVECLCPFHYSCWFGCCCIAVRMVFDVLSNLGLVIVVASAWVGVRTHESTSVVHDEVVHDVEGAWHWALRCGHTRQCTGKRSSSERRLCDATHVTGFQGIVIGLSNPKHYICDWFICLLFLWCGSLNLLLQRTEQLFLYAELGPATHRSLVSFSSRVVEDCCLLCWLHVQVGRHIACSWYLCRIFEL